jgi:hypothetical protein
MARTGYRNRLSLPQFRDEKDSAFTLCHQIKVLPKRATPLQAAATKLVWRRSLGLPCIFTCRVLKRLRGGLSRPHISNRVIYGVTRR